MGSEANNIGQGSTHFGYVPEMVALPHEGIGEERKQENKIMDKRV